MKYLESVFNQIKIAQDSSDPRISMPLRENFYPEKYNFSDELPVTFFPNPAITDTEFLYFDFAGSGIKTNSLTFSVYGNPKTSNTTDVYRDYFTCIDPDIFTDHAIIEMKTTNGDTYLLWQNPVGLNHETLRLGSSLVFDRSLNFYKQSSEQKVWQVTGPHTKNSAQDILLKNSIMPEALLNACEYAFSYFNFCVGDSYRDGRYHFEYDDTFYRRIIVEALIQCYPGLSPEVYRSIFISLENKSEKNQKGWNGLIFFYPDKGSLFPYYGFEATKIFDKYSNKDKNHPVFNDKNLKLIENVRNEYKERLSFFRKNGFLNVKPDKDSSADLFFQSLAEIDIPVKREALHNYHQSLNDSAKNNKANPFGCTKQNNLTGWHLSKNGLMVGDILDSEQHVSELQEVYDIVLSKGNASEIASFSEFREREANKPEYIHTSINAVYSFLSLENARDVVLNENSRTPWGNATHIYKVEYEGDAAVVDETHFDNYLISDHTAEIVYRKTFGYPQQTKTILPANVSKYWSGEGSLNPVWTIVGNKARVTDIIEL